MRAGRAAAAAGPRRDVLVLLASGAFVVPSLKRFTGISPILGFLLTGVLLGPNGLGAITASSSHAFEPLAELGVDFFLFEMGLELRSAGSSR